MVEGGTLPPSNVYSFIGSQLKLNVLYMYVIFDPCNDAMLDTMCIILLHDLVKSSIGVFLLYYIQERDSHTCVTCGAT